jgi:hypothetical protein
LVDAGERRRVVTARVVKVERREDGEIMVIDCLWRRRRRKRRKG